MNATAAPGCDYPRQEPVTQILRLDNHIEALREADDMRAFYADESRCEVIVDAVRNIAVAERIKVISFDVFDTALLRECRSEAGRFRDISERFVAHCRSEGEPPPFSAEDALLARAMAARAAYAISPSAAGNREGRFEDIARITCDLLGRPDLTPAYIANELAYEEDALMANPLVVRLTRSLPDTKAIFISDMYLEGDKIAGLLTKRLGMAVAGRVHSSADGLGSKRTGGIFQHVETLLQVSAEQILHIGDSLRSDYQMPKRRGWHAFHLPMPANEIRSRRACHDAVKAYFARAGIRLSRYLQFNP